MSHIPLFLSIAVHKNSGPPSTHLPLTGGDLQLTEGHGDYPGVGEEERRYECHDEFPKEGLSEGEVTLKLVPDASSIVSKTKIEEASGTSLTL